jgi:hypothetical protein
LPELAAASVASGASGGGGSAGPSGGAMVRVEGSLVAVTLGLEGSCVVTVSRSRDRREALGWVADWCSDYQAVAMGSNGVRV